MIRVDGLTKEFGGKLAVDHLNFTVQPGMVTGFLGPNGAGKSTTMRLIMGLDHPNSGTSSVNGKPYADHAAPLQEVGALLEAKAAHPGRTAINHLKGVAYANGIPLKRVHEVIEMTGLTSVANKRAGTFSLGMSQRLGIATALLGDPETVMLDEPINGLDPDGVRWVRRLLTELAQQGRTVFVSSHLMSEMTQVADRLIIVGRGRLLADTTLEDFIHSASRDTVAVTVATPQPDRLREALVGPDIEVSGEAGSQQLMVNGCSAQQVGTIAAQHGITLYELKNNEASLEDAFMRLTHEAVEYRGLDLRGGAA